MRRTIVLLAAIAAMVVVYAGTALAEDTLDAHYSLDGTAPSYTGFNQNYKEGQTFTVENTGDLNKAEVTVSRGETTGATLYMDIVSVNASGLPTDNVLASASLPYSEISIYSGVETFTFDEPAVVRAGKQYAFVLHGGDTTTYSFGLAGDSYSGSPGYPGGQGYWLNHDYTVLGEIRDHLFAIYVAPRDVPDVTGPELSLPDDITQEAEGPDGAMVSWSATATDDVDASVTVTCASDSGLKSGDTFPLGTTQVNCSATDAANNTTSDSFNVTVVDTTVPGAATSLSATPGDTKVDLSWTNPTDSDFDKVRVLRSTSQAATGPEPESGQTQVYEGTSTSYSDTGLTNFTQYYYTVFARDTAGNWSSAASTNATPTSPDSTAPTGSVLINNGKAKTKKLAVTLNLTATDSGSGVKEMCVSHSTTSCTSWEPFTSAKSWKLPKGGSATKTVYVKFRDNAGNESAVFKDTIKYAP